MAYFKRQLTDRAPSPELRQLGITWVHPENPNRQYIQKISNSAIENYAFRVMTNGQQQTRKEKQALITTVEAADWVVLTNGRGLAVLYSELTNIELGVKLRGWMRQQNMQIARFDCQD